MPAPAHDVAETTNYLQSNTLAECLSEELTAAGADMLPSTDSSFVSQSSSKCVQMLVVSAITAHHFMFSNNSTISDCRVIPCLLNNNG